jgi:hypothetical protein
MIKHFNVVQLTEKLFSAACVIALTEETRIYLSTYDPQALSQLDRALSFCDPSYHKTLENALEIWKQQNLFGGSNVKI